MGLFDQVLGAATGAASANGGNALLDTAMQLINQNGGVAGLVQAFQRGGLADVVNSWVSTGNNLPVSADQLAGLLGDSQLGEIAGKLGLSREDAAGQLAALLPRVIDGLTPNGSIPEGGDLMAQGLDLLRGKLFG